MKSSSRHWRNFEGKIIIYTFRWYLSSKFSRSASPCNRSRWIVNALTLLNFRFLFLRSNFIFKVLFFFFRFAVDGSSQLLGVCVRVLTARNFVVSERKGLTRIFKCFRRDIFEVKMEFVFVFKSQIYGNIIDDTQVILTNTARFLIYNFSLCANWI